VKENRVSRGDQGDLGTDSFYPPSGFMTCHVRENGLTVGGNQSPGHSLEIGAAHAGGGDLDDHVFTAAQLWIVDLAHFHAAELGNYRGNHDLSSFMSSRTTALPLTHVGHR
jgi:hypothetical protein